MPTDNTTLNAGTGGETIRSLADASNINWPVGVTAYATTLSAGANVLAPVTPTAGLPVQPQTGATWAVTGTFWQATQPVSVATIPSHDVTNAGTFAVQAAQAGVWNITNISGTVSLPTGAATSAKQDTGNTSLASIDGKTPALGQALAAASVPVVLTAAQLTTLTPPAAITGYSTEATLSTLNGKVTACNTGAVTISAALPAGANTIGAVTIAAAQTLATVTTVGTVTTVTSLTQMNGQAIAMGTGVRSAGTQRVTIATDDVVPASQSGTWNIGTVSVVTGVTNTVVVNDAPVTSGGLSVSSFLSTAAVQSTAVKASAGMVYAVEFFNTGATPVYVRLYNQTTAPASTDGANLLWRGVVPGNTAGAGFVKTWDKGLAFGTGIGMRCTAAVADNDATALSANAVVGNVCFK